MFLLACIFIAFSVFNAEINATTLVYYNETTEHVTSLGTTTTKGTTSPDRYEYFIIRALECNKSCTICGRNSINCIFYPNKCELVCNCKPEYTGENCNVLLDSTIDANMVSTEKLPTITVIATTISNNYTESSKELLWLEIFKSFQNSHLITLDETFNIIKKMLSLITQFQFTFDMYDMQNTYLIISNLTHSLNNNYNLRVNNEEISNNLVLNIIDYLYQYLDKLIEINFSTTATTTTTTSSLFNIANRHLNRTSIKLFNAFESLIINYININSYNNNAFSRLSHYYRMFNMMLLNNLNLHDTTFSLTANNIDKSKTPEAIELDSISINKLILKNIFKNETVSVLLNIFYTQYNNQNYSSSTYFESTDTTFSLKSSLFFDIDSEDMMSNSSIKASNQSYIASSTILSAVIIHKTKIITHLATSLADNNINNRVENLYFVRIQFTIRINRFNNITNNLKCVYWNDDKLNWSTNGCYESTNETIHFQLNSNFYYRKVCYCNHLTNFALLFDPNIVSNIHELTINDEINLNMIDDLIFTYFISIISYIGIIVSLICYLIMILTRLFDNKNASLFQILRKMKHQTIQHETNTIGKRDFILKYLYLTHIILLFVSNILFILLTLVKRNTNFNFCLTIGLSLQYTLLASFCLSLGIAYQHFIKLIFIFTQNYNKKIFLFKWYLLTFLLPIPFVIFEYNYDTNYFKEFKISNYYCWLTKPYIYYFFVSPLLVMLAISFLFYLFIAIKVCYLYNTNCILFNTKNKLFECLSQFDHSSSLSTTSSSTTSSSLSSSATSYNSYYNNKYVISLLVFSALSLNLTWLLGIFIIISSNLNNKSFKYLAEFFFCICNSFHGISLLVGQYMAQKYCIKASNLQFNKITNNKCNHQNHIHHQKHHKNDQTIATTTTTLTNASSTLQTHSSSCSFSSSSSSPSSVYKSSNLLLTRQQVLSSKRYRVPYSINKIYYNDNKFDEIETNYEDTINIDSYINDNVTTQNSFHVVKVDPYTSSV